MTEYEKMVAGKAYNGFDPEIQALQRRQMALLDGFNTLGQTDPKRREILAELCPKVSKTAYFRGPLWVDYGCHITIGERFYANYNCTILDVCPVTIGNDCLFGPNVSLLTPMHPFDYRDRYPEEGHGDIEYGKPIVIEDAVWLCGGVTVCAGVTIGKGSVIGAGSVVTRDIPPGVLAAGNPCRVIRPITEADRLENLGIL